MPEQDKIAAFLISVNDKLNKLRCKRYLLEAYKRGLMQKIFKQELRFTQEDGTAFPGWEEKKLCEVYGWVRTNNLSREMLTDEAGVVQNIHYGDIHMKFSSRFDQTTADAPYIKDPKLIENLAEEE